MFWESVLCSVGGSVSRFVFWESVLDDVLVEALFLGLCYWSEAVDDVLFHADVSVR